MATEQTLGPELDRFRMPLSVATIADIDRATRHKYGPGCVVAQEGKWLVLYAPAKPKVVPVTVKIIFGDWLQKGEDESIYGTELGIELSKRDLHSGTTWHGVRVELPADIAREIKLAWDRHQAYPVFCLVPEEEGRRVVSCAHSSAECQSICDATDGRRR